MMTPKEKEMKYLEDLCKAIIKDKGYTYVALIGYDYWIQRQVDKMFSMGLKYGDVYKLLEKYKIYKK